jgi:protein-histidine pros-kinase
MSTVAASLPHPLPHPRLLPDSIFARLFLLVIGAILCSHLMTSLLVVNIVDRFTGPQFFVPETISPECAAPDVRHGRASILNGLPHARSLGFQSTPHGAFPHYGRGFGHGLPPAFWLGLSVQFLMLTLAAWFGAKMLARPITELAQGAAELGNNLNAPAVRESGPREARQAARVFNRMRERIRANVEERERFLAAVSHDLRSPLTRMKLRLQRLSSEGAQQKFEDDIDEMAAMLNATLDYLRGDAAQDAPQLVDVQALIEAMAEDAREAGEDVTVSGAIAPMPAYPLALRRCLSNLIGNALRYGERAEITLCDADGQARIDIRDFGPGIPEDKMALVFEPFVRLESSRNKATGGVGLGLAIARAAAMQCGGRLTLRNAEDGGLVASLVFGREAGH